MGLALLERIQIGAFLPPVEAGQDPAGKPFAIRSHAGREPRCLNQGGGTPDTTQPHFD